MPVIESLAGEFTGRARFVKVHVDEEGAIQKAFNSSGIPAYILFKNGMEVDRIGWNLFGWFLEGRVRSMVEGAL